MSNHAIPLGLHHVKPRSPPCFTLCQTSKSALLYSLPNHDILLVLHQIKPRNNHCFTSSQTMYHEIPLDLYHAKPRNPSWSFYITSNRGCPIVLHLIESWNLPCFISYQTTDSPLFYIMQNHGITFVFHHTNLRNPPCFSWHQITEPLVVQYVKPWSPSYITLRRTTEFSLFSITWNYDSNPSFLVSNDATDSPLLYITSNHGISIVLRHTKPRNRPWMIF